MRNQNLMTLCYKRQGFILQQITECLVKMTEVFCCLANDSRDINQSLCFFMTVHTHKLILVKKFMETTGWYLII